MFCEERKKNIANKNTNGSPKIRQHFCAIQMSILQYCHSWKSDNYTGSKTEKKHGLIYTIQTKNLLN